jgi:hypothetical protein
MNTILKNTLALILGITAVFALSPGASAGGRFGLSGGGPIGIHVGTRSGVGVSLPAPEARVGIDGPYDASVTFDPHGARVRAIGPYGTSAGVSTGGGYYAGATQHLPGGATVSGGVDQDGVSADAGYEYPLEPITYAGTY